jgi:hypothetical protein
MRRQPDFKPRSRPGTQAAAFALSALALASILSCGGTALDCVVDPVWNESFPKESRDFLSGARQAGFAPRLRVFPMEGLPESLSLSINGLKGSMVLLSPLFGSEISRLQASFPGKTFILPGVELGVDMAGLYSSRSDILPAIGKMGQIGAEIAQGSKAKASTGASARPEVLMGGNSPSSEEVVYVAAIFPLGQEGDAQEEAFREGFGYGNKNSGKALLSLRRVSENKAEVESIIRDFSSLTVGFLFISAGRESAAALAAVPERGWVVAGLRLKDLEGFHPQLAGSVEDDWKALAKAALSEAKVSGKARSQVPARILRLSGDREGVFSKISFNPSIFSAGNGR